MDKLEAPVTERRRHTRNSIYQMIFRARTPVSKQEISTQLGYSLPTVHQNISELLDAGLIRIGEVKKSTGGRPPVGYEICPDAKFAVGAAISANHLRFLACNLAQEEIAYRSIRVANLDVKTVGGAELKTELAKFFEDYHLDRSRMLGLGVTIPGIFDEKSDTILLSPTLKAKNISMKQFMEESEFPVRVLNDSTSAGKAELAHRRENGEDLSFVYIFLENGIGGAIFNNGYLYNGANGRSAEFGHMRIVPGGKTCNCGQEGCLEAYCSMFRITRDIGLTIEEFFDKVHAAGKGEKDPVRSEASAISSEECAALWEDVLDHLAMGIVNIRMAFDCDVIIGGLLTVYLGEYLDKLRAKVAALDTFENNGEYVKLSFNPRAAMRGGAWEFSEEFINSI